jgi:hypothetical protein
MEGKYGKLYRINDFPEALEAFRQIEERYSIIFDEKRAKREADQREAMKKLENFYIPRRLI